MTQTMTMAPDYLGPCKAGKIDVPRWKFYAMNALWFAIGVFLGWYWF